MEESGIVKEFLHNYFSQNIFVINRIESGIENCNYLVILNKNKYVLRIYRRKKLSQIKNEVRLIEYLVANNILTPKIIYTKKKEAINTLKKKNAVLFEFIEGSHPPWKILNPKLCEDMGYKISQMHKTLLSFDANLFKIDLANSFENISNINTADKTLLDKRDEVLNEIKSIDLSNLRRCVIHGDINRENVLILQNKLASIIDFDDAHQDYLIWDIATTVSQLFVTRSAGVDWEGIKYFITGYSNNIRLIAEEKNILIPFLKLVNIKLAILIDLRIKSKDGDLEGLISIKESLLTRLKLIEDNDAKLKILFSKYF